MAHDGTGAGYDDAAPADGDVISNGAKEIRDLRKGLKYRLDKEHVTLAAGTLDGSDLDTTGGGEHKIGSALAYSASSAPTERPGGDTLTSADEGRLWVDTGNDFLYYYDGSAWVAIGFVLGTSSILANAVTTAKIADDNVTGAKIAANAIDSDHYTDDSIDTAHYAPASVDTAAIAGNAVTRAKIADTNYVWLREEQTANTNGGTFTSGAWRTRVLNQEKSDVGLNCTLSSNAFELGAGTWEIYATAPGFRCGVHKAILRNTTGNADVLVGTSEVNPAGENVQTRSIVSGRFDIPAGQDLEIWHWCGSTRADTGLGYAVNIDSKVEVYTEVHLHKITD